MTNRYLLQINSQYLNSVNDSTSLFQTLLEIADEIGLDTALGYLQTCVLRKRGTWIERMQGTFIRTDDPIMDAYRLFYEDYLGLSVPEDGEIIERSPTRLVMRWWNECPTLCSCQKFGLDTQVICRRVYHAPVQLLFSALDPRLHFDRNYQALRPRAAYCEEIISFSGIPN
jgi:hypothetical protein